MGLRIKFLMNLHWDKNRSKYPTVHRSYHLPRYFVITDGEDFLFVAKIGDPLMSSQKKRRR